MSAPLTTKVEAEAQVTAALAEWLAGFDEVLKDDGLFPGIRGVLELGFRGGFRGRLAMDHRGPA